MKSGSVRIIGGKWRGRRLKVPNVEGLRPTPDRVRETLFNWLATIVPGAHCLDLFAGSGVLGFEAASRGAASVVMVDAKEEVVNTLQEECKLFKTDHISIYRATLPQQLRPLSHPADVVFLDPPYQADLLLPCCHYLEENQFLADTAYIYLEASQVIKDNELPNHWRLIKSREAGQVAYHLALRELKKHDYHRK